MLLLKNLACMRSGRRLFQGLSCEVPAGQLLRVQGANGAGKTSLLRIICGLLEPSEGQASWCGQSISTLQEDLGRQMIYLGHAAALKDDLSPLENLQAASALGGQALSAFQGRAARPTPGVRGFERTHGRGRSRGRPLVCGIG